MLRKMQSNWVTVTQKTKKGRCMMNAKNQAILLMVKTKATKDKPKPSLGYGNPKDDGKAEWVRFKSECVLLTKKGGVR